MAQLKVKNRQYPLQEETEQLELIPSGNNPFWHSSLFNEVFLQNDVPVKYQEKWEMEEAGPFYEFCNGFRNLCEELRDEDFESWSERNTINRFIKPVLELLGYKNNCSVSQEPWAEDEPFSVREGGRSKTYKPDLIIVNDPKELKYVERKKGEEKVAEARHLVILPIEAKYWDRIEDARQLEGEDQARADKSAKDETDKLMSFDEQCLKYMEILGKDYGILTDGKTWRLYNAELSSGSYKRHYQFNLGRLLLHVNAGLDTSARDYEQFVENAKYFFHIFSKEALYSESGDRRFVDDLLEYSKKYVSKVEEDLKDRFVQAMSIACNGFHRAAKIEKTAMELSQIRNIAESHLFNILFIKYCEARNILPLKQAPDYRKISITNVIDKLEHFDPEKEADQLNFPILKRMFSKDFSFSPEGTELYDRLLKLTKIIQEGTGNEFSSFEIKGFKESIFSKDEWKFVTKLKLNNAEMVNVLFELGYSESDIKGKRFQQIPYNFFSPRQLGSIYESFLEFRLEKAEEDMVFIKRQWTSITGKTTKLRLVGAPRVKKGQLFFTPDNKDRKASGSYYTPDAVVQYIVSQTLSPIVEHLKPQEILKIKVIDPAMGSGHFLAAAIGFLAQKYAEACAAADIIKSEADVKRLILENCIYGVDINPRAVKLAKMSLWLESAMGGRTLENLDDQLYVGDSLEINRRNSYSLPEFDAVVGNPPYGYSFSEDECRKILSKYKHIHKNFDSFQLFIEELAEQGSIKTKPNGLIGLIIPSSFLTLDAFSSLRRKVVTESNFLLAAKAQYQVFEDAHIDTCIVVFGKHPTAKEVIRYAEFGSEDLLRDVDFVEHKIDQVLKDPACTLRFVNDQSGLGDLTKTVGDYFDVRQGTKAYQVGKGKPKQTREMVNEKCFSSMKKKDKTYLPYLYGSDVGQFHVNWKGGEYVKFGDHLAEPRHGFHEGPRVVVQRIRNPKLQRRLVAAFTEGEEISSAGLSILVPNDSFKGSVKALCLYLNLPSVNEWFRGVNDDVNIKPTVIRTIPLNPEFLKEGGILDKEATKIISSKIEAKNFEAILASIDKELFPRKTKKKAA
jgi:type I restriction-modification system DNA methylase subunit